MHELYPKKRALSTPRKIYQCNHNAFCTNVGYLIYFQAAKCPCQSPAHGTILPLPNAYAPDSFIYSGSLGSSPAALPPFRFLDERYALHISETSCLSTTGECNNICYSGSKSSLSSVTALPEQSVQKFLVDASRCIRGNVATASVCRVDKY
jgi:hypothetical protein